MDDSEGNLLSAVENGLKAETIYVQPQEGLTSEVLSYVEGRMGDMSQAAFSTWDEYVIETRLQASEKACEAYLGKWVERRGNRKCAPPKKKRVRCPKLTGSTLCTRVGCSETFRTQRCIGRPVWKGQPRRPR